MALFSPTHRIQLYRLLADIPLLFAGAALLNLVLFAIDLGLFGGPRHHPSPRKITALILGDGLLIASVVAAAATYRTPHTRAAGQRCAASYLLLVLGYSALLFIPDL